MQIVRLDQKTGSNNLLSIRNTLHNQRHTQTKSSRLEKDLPGMWKPKAKNSYSHIRKKQVLCKHKTEEIKNIITY
jgi:hypothetical protein